jgi:Family of unknown function (DUF6166)
MSKEKRKRVKYTGYRVYQHDLEGALVSQETVVVAWAGKVQVPLAERFDIRNHSPTGFEWGYCGSGPAQLALALVADACGDAYAIPEIYQMFKQIVVSGLAKEGWSLTHDQVANQVSAIMHTFDIHPALPVDD